ncbi:MAG: HDOD domain-containing protein [Planctomycetaceae bacterium]
MTANMDWKGTRERLLGPPKRSILPPSVKLPVLPTALMEFSRKSSEPDATPKGLGEIIESDAGLTCELLRYVNSSAVAVRQKVSSAVQALTLLGVRQARLHLTSSALRTAMKSSESKLVNFQVFWNTNLERAIFAREVAKLLKADVDLAFAGGMLQDFLLPILTSQLLEDYLKLSKLQAEKPVEMSQFEKAIFNWDHAEAASHIMLAWGFPDDLICCVACHHRGLKMLTDKELGRTSVAACAVAGLMPDPFRQVPEGFDRLLELEAAWPAFKILEIARTVDQEFRTMSPPGAAANHFTFLRRCEKLMQASAC